MSNGAVRARLAAAARDPIETFVTWKARRDPSAFARRHGRLARRTGIDRVYLVLSFDCDTSEDAAVVTAVHTRLARLGVMPVYAVPGALLARAQGVYGRLAEDGAEFLNHGGVEHTYFDEDAGRYRSCFFYDQLEPNGVTRDVVEGHEIVEQVVGAAPRGFRTPHFGTYQKPAQLRHLHGILASLGYRFSTSTSPRFGLRHGPVSRVNGVHELPVTGTPTAPFEILDTWAFFAAPDRVHAPADYVRQAELLADAMRRSGAGVINVYGDPIHIHDRPEFFEAIEAWVSVAEPISYSSLLDRIAT